MSAVLDTPLNGLGMIPLVRTIEGFSMSKSYREALNTVVSACRGELKRVSQKEPLQSSQESKFKCLFCACINIQTDYLLFSDQIGHDPLLPGLRRCSRTENKSNWEPYVASLLSNKLSANYWTRLSFTGDMDGCAVIFVCGTRNVGKSTFVRTLINTLLNQ